MRIELRRIRLKPDTIDGRIYIDGLHVCDSAENARNALPVGTYSLAIRKCRRLGRKMPVVLLNTVPRMPDCGGDCCCRRLCPGNGVYHRLDGCIIVGEYRVPGVLIHPRPAFDALYERIRKNIERHNNVTLRITD